MNVHEWKKYNSEQLKDLSESKMMWAVVLKINLVGDLVWSDTTNSQYQLEDKGRSLGQTSTLEGTDLKCIWKEAWRATK